ncbi:hypothetical protein GCM10007390_29240 [Persicitalea jodogahamensis]|uniref:Gylcosyl hydrolase 115 C-terminal domain-containing protein n=1 Tax=Persicitalea jodogahamensis TaxID=402147 RepID=A0A8J3DBN5_9BACT|nr:hypothetical protein GCM10007390_29240 [Persicitalea jodogahamensis]
MQSFFLLFLLSFSGLLTLSAQNKIAIDGKPIIKISNPDEEFEKFLAEFLTDDLAKVFDTKNENISIVLRLVNDKTPRIKKKFLEEIDKEIQNKWETFSYTTYNTNTLVVTGSDKRGLAYGVFGLSERAGVSPWHFWADVPVQKRKEAFWVNDSVSLAPSVKYRGIFINDEDWGLQPWAAKTFETGLKDIGPKTYAKVFELLLRLKANLIWPAMHPSTKAFYHYPENKEVAQKYQIVVGTSHAEPLMRNNVDEWNDQTMGEYNYITNSAKIRTYWQSRLEEIKGFGNLYSIGMRGKHDSGMEGTKNEAEAVELTNRIINDQRQLLSQVTGKAPAEVPQVMTLYKEVLDLYKAGLNVPEDVTLIWPDDNYGYIKSLSNETERKRTGGAGVYYHASYWGRPHDYLWIGTTDPALMRFEMQKAYETGARNVWVVNVGDIKAIEYPTQLFLDMAYDIRPFLTNESVFKHLENWTKSNLNSKEAAALLWKNYRLSYIRKPEFMGWSKVEPTTPTHPTTFSLEEVEERLAAYDKLDRETLALQPRNSDYASAYFQLVGYPVRAASQMNKKFLNLDLYYTTKSGERTDNNPYFQKAVAAYDSIVSLTNKYNHIISNGKWNHVMTMNPRQLPVFSTPEALKNVEQKSTVSVPKSLVDIPAGDYSRISSTPDAYWEKISEPGFSGNLLVSRPFTIASPLKSNQPQVEYDFNLPETGSVEIKIKAIPLHPLTLSSGQKVALQVDEGTWQMVDFETIGRSEEWKENVLSNQTTKSLSVLKLVKGKHTLKLRMIDAGVLIDSFKIFGIR